MKSQRFYVQKLLMSFLGIVALPLTLDAQLYQDVSNSTTAIVRDPVRQASTEIDAVINNPAGTAFMDDGWHISLNAKVATQEIVDNYEEYQYNKYFTRDFIPSMQLAYKKKNWTISGSFANEGGSGNGRVFRDIRFERTLNAVYTETVMQDLTNLLKVIGINTNGDQMVGIVETKGDNLYNLTGRIGGALQMGKWSIYFGARINYVSENSYSVIDNDIIKSNGSIVNPSQYMSDLAQQIRAGNNLSDLAMYFAKAQVAESFEKKGLIPNYISKESKMNGWGITPVIGVDFNPGDFNFAFKYEMGNKIHTSKGYKSFHIPHLFSLGANWKPLDYLKLGLGSNVFLNRYKDMYGSSQSYHIIYGDKILEVESYELNGTMFTYDFSGSFSFMPIKGLWISAGYTYTNQYAYDKRVFPLSTSRETEFGDIFSAGLLYNINKTIDFELGISKKNLYVLDTKDYSSTTISAGVNVNF